MSVHRFTRPPSAATSRHQPKKFDGNLTVTATARPSRGRELPSLLTVRAVAQAHPRETPWKLHDQHGLYLSVQPSGAKWWRWDYRYAGKRNTLSLGVYPDVTLAAARATHRELRLLLKAGEDPSAARRRAALAARGTTVEAVGTAWLTQQARLAPHTRAVKQWRFDRYVVPAIGRRPIAVLAPADVLGLLRPIEARGHHEVAHRLRQMVSQILRYAVATGQAARDITADLRGALTPVTVTHHPALTEPAQIGALLRALEDYDGRPVVRLALTILPYVFVRPGELRHAEWREIDLDAALWRIPAARMKMRDDHAVPLATQVVTWLRALKLVTGRGRLVFPSLRGGARPISAGTLNAALRRLGYGPDEMVPHGFRAIASTRLNELGWAPDLIELQLAHRERNASRAAYNRAMRIEERRVMMQAWADYLDRLRAMPLR